MKIYGFYVSTDDWDEPVYSKYFSTEDKAKDYVHKYVRKRIADDKNDDGKEISHYQKCLCDFQKAIEMGIKELYYLASKGIKEDNGVAFMKAADELIAKGCPLKHDFDWETHSIKTVSTVSDNGDVFRIHCYYETWDCTEEEIEKEIESTLKWYKDEIKMLKSEDYKEQEQEMLTEFLKHIDEIELDAD